MESTKRAMIGVIAFLLCVFFFMFPIVQCPQDSSIAPTGWRIASSKFTSLSVGVDELDVAIKEFSNYLNSYNIPNETYEEKLISEEFAQKDTGSAGIYINDLDTETNEDTNYLSESILEEINIEELDTAIRGAWNYLNEKRKNNINLLVFILLIIPIVIIVLAFLKVSLKTLRNIIIIGIIAKIIFITIVYTSSGEYFIPTLFCWSILVIYIGLCVFSQYCIKSD